jgi:TolB-like protein
VNRTKAPDQQGDSVQSPETEVHHSRRLKAIFFADVAGYTRLMGKDEEVTQTVINDFISDFGKICQANEGELLDIRGDGIFAVFDSVVGAVRSAIDFQDAVEGKNKDISDDSCITFRIGIHLGDVLSGAGHYFGDSVNIAARLESLATPGGVCVSRAVYEQVRNKLQLGFEYLGPQRLKNLSDPVDAYYVHNEINHAVMVASPRIETAPMSNSNKANRERTSMVVLPFLNISGDAEQDYFSDGISEDITTNLSKFHNLFVIARGSAFTYKGKHVPAQQVGQELGVQYVAEGSIRKVANKIRISVQLTDAIGGQTLWGERYDREIDDLFAVQDEITEYIVGATAVQIETAERERMRQNPPTDLKAYSLVLQGQQHFFRYTKSDNFEARQMYEAAHDADPYYARAVAAISRALNIDWRYSWSDSPEEALDQALELARRSVSLDHTDSRGHSELGFVYLYRKEHDLSISAYKRALALNPNDADVMSDMADALMHAGRSEEAIELLSKAMLLNPFYPDQYLWHLSGAYYNLKRYDEAIETVLRMNNPAEGRRLLAASYGQLGHEAEARQHAAKVLAVHPEFSLENWAMNQPDRYPEDTEHFVEGLKKAGL